MHDIITRDANSESWAEIWEFSKLLCDIIDVIIITKVIVFDKILNINWLSFCSWIQTSNFTTIQYGRQMPRQAV